MHKEFIALILIKYTNPLILWHIAYMYKWRPNSDYLFTGREKINEA